jgi:F-type H+-transporting ATPase subunit b
MRPLIKARFYALFTLVTMPSLALARGGHGGAKPDAAKTAAEGAHDAGHAEAHIANWWNVGADYSDSPALGLLAITFLIFAGGLIISVRGPLSNFLEARSRDIKNAIEEASRAKAEAEAKAAEYEKRLAALDTEIDSLRNDFEKQGQAERDRLEAAGKALAERIAADTEATVSAEIIRARETLHNDAAQGAVALAEKKVKELLAADDESNLTQGFVKSLSA